MPQMARTDDKKPDEQIKAVGNRVADTAHAVAAKSRELTRDAAETTASVVERTAAKSAAVAEQVAGSMRQLASATPAARNDVFGFWRDLVQTQVAQNVDAIRRLAAARTWQERVEVQSNYLAGNVARMSEAASRYAELSGTMVKRLLNAGVRETKKAG